MWQLLLLQNYEINRFVLGITQIWSLGTEVAFYVVLPLLAIALGLVARDRAGVARPGRLLTMLAAAVGRNSGLARRLPRRSSGPVHRSPLAPPALRVVRRRDGAGSSRGGGAARRAPVPPAA